MTKEQALHEKMAALDLRNRESQNIMIQKVSDAIKNKRILCIEAPTGTGKTLAYSLGALLEQKHKKSLVISTATTALQEQFLHKDLPLIEKILSKKFLVVLAKGRRRYVCHDRLFNPSYELPESDGSQINQLQQLLEQNKWSGEIDNSPIDIKADLWQSISTESSMCSSNKCAYFNDCVFFQNKRKMEKADIVVTNHSLLLSDIELGGGVVLPKIEDSIYVIDECHHFPEKALSHFAKQSALLRSFEWINTISKTLTKSQTHLSDNTLNIESINQTIKQLVTHIREANTYLNNKKLNFIDTILRINFLDIQLKSIVESILEASKVILKTVASIDQKLDVAYEASIAQHAKENAANIASLKSTLKFILNRCENLYSTWLDIKKFENIQTPIPFACWFEKVNSHTEEDHTLHTSPINVSDSMKKLFWNKISNGLILCSATIRSLGAFDDFFRKMGLSQHPCLDEIALSSPFEHQHSLLYVPQMKTEPKQEKQEAHLTEIIELLPNLINDQGGTLLLFTSKKAMEFVLDKIPHELKRDVLAQNDYSKMLILARHKEKINKKQRSIIFGLASFAEGIDLPGDYCRHVILQKIPFNVPSDPISLARTDWLKHHKKDPFKLISLPDTSIKLAQYIGRLLRHENDTGIVTILDNRLYNKPYGAALLENLPNFTRLINQPLSEFSIHFDRIFSMDSP